MTMRPPSPSRGLLASPVRRQAVASPERLRAASPTRTDDGQHSPELFGARATVKTLRPSVDGVTTTAPPPPRQPLQFVMPAASTWSFPPAKADPWTAHPPHDGGDRCDDADMDAVLVSPGAFGNRRHELPLKRLRTYSSVVLDLGNVTIPAPAPDAAEEAPKLTPPRDSDNAGAMTPPPRKAKPAASAAAAAVKGERAPGAYRPKMATLPTPPPTVTPVVRPARPAKRSAFDFDHSEDEGITTPATTPAAAPRPAAKPKRSKTVVHSDAAPASSEAGPADGDQAATPAPTAKKAPRKRVRAADGTTTPTVKTTAKAAAKAAAKATSKAAPRSMGGPQSGKLNVGKAECDVGSRVWRVAMRDA